MEVFINIFLQYPGANITEEINIMVISPCSIYFDFRPINYHPFKKSKIPQEYRIFSLWLQEYFTAEKILLSLWKKRNFRTCSGFFTKGFLVYYLTFHVVSNSPWKKGNYIMFSKVPEML